MANYTQQCRTCHVNIEGTGEDICYRCLQRERDCARARYSAMERAEASAHEQIYQLQKERDALKGENERLKDESSRFERVAFTYETDMDKLQGHISELESAIARQDHGQPDGSEWCAWNERRWKECTPENCIWLKCSTSP